MGEVALFDVGAPDSPLSWPSPSRGKGKPASTAAQTVGNWD